MKMIFSSEDSDTLDAIMAPVFEAERRERKQTRVFLVILTLALLTIAGELAYIWRVELMEWITLSHRALVRIIQASELLL